MKNFWDKIKHKLYIMIPIFLFIGIIIFAFVYEPTQTQTPEVFPIGETCPVPENGADGCNKKDITLDKIETILTESLLLDFF